MRWTLLRDDGLTGRSLATVVLVAAWVATWRPQIDPDAWWHVALGELIMANGAVPTTEPFSWLTTGGPFVAHSWLWDVAMALAYRAAGATGTSLLVLPVTAVIIGLLWVLIGMAAPSSPPLGRAGLVVVAVVAVLPLWGPRAQTLDIAFVLATVLLLARYLRADARRGLVALPIIGLIWANVHGSAILGLAATIGVALVARPVGIRWGTWPRRPVGPIVAAGLAAIVAAAVNPYGVDLLTYPFDREVASAFSSAIIEWQSPDFDDRELWVVRAILAGAALLAIAPHWRSRDPFLLLVSGAWTFAALGSVRFLAIAAPLLVIALAPVIGPSIGRWLGRRGQWASVAESDAGRTGRADRFVIGGAGVVIAGILAAGWLLIEPAQQSAAISSRMPVAAAPMLDESRCPARMLPAYDWAGYVIWFAGREVGAYGNSAERTVTEMAHVETVMTDPRPWLDAHGVGAVLMPAGRPLSRWLDEADEWRLAYRDAQATLHVRADDVSCPLTSSADVASLRGGRPNTRPAP